MNSEIENVIYYNVMIILHAYNIFLSIIVKIIKRL